MLMILARLVRSESFWAVVKVRSPHTGPEVSYPRTWTTKNWLGLQKQRISVVLHTAIAEQIVNELACGGGGRVHGAKCLAALAGVA